MGDFLLRKITFTVWRKMLVVVKWRLIVMPN